MIIYKIIFPNNKSYIGQTIKSLKQRQSEHFSELQRSDFKVYRAIKKYGWENLKWEIIEEIKGSIQHPLLNEREIYWISYFNTYKNGYNSTIGGYGSKGYKPSLKELKRMSDSMKGENNPAKRKEVQEKMKNAWTEDRRKKQSERMIGNQRSGKWSEKRKKEFSKYMKEKCQNDKNYLKKRTEKLKEKMKEPETIKKIKERMKGIKNPNFKWIYNISKESKKYTTEGFTLEEFCKKNKQLKLRAKSIYSNFLKINSNKIKYKGWEIERRLHANKT